MSANEMLSLQLTLDPHPGSIPPILHLKQGATSMGLTLYIKGLSVNETRACMAKGTRPDGSELYISTTNLGSAGNLRLSLGTASIKKMTEVAGRYLVEVTVFNGRSGINRRNVSFYDTLTTAKFYVDVAERAYSGRDENEEGEEEA